ncbi:MAG: exodeoxyribonuclease V subunit gamma [Clostridiales Family XIII bacterium]|jgi:ATP-dependent helicase/nuclease subunit B|nr:exodeoxyribonuclease V subunit gamma [Clostridiales Family XIII bacterium]
MLTIHYGREDVDKQRFLFGQIRSGHQAGVPAGRTYLVVPDQFTLETERSAFDYLETDAFIDPVVLSMNRLASKVLAETGQGMNHIDQYGKYMLLARLLHRESRRDGLRVYGGMENAQAFIEKLSDAIMSLKVHLVSPEDLAAAAQGLGDDGLLRDKLSDIALVYAGYEEALADGLPDSTDVMRLFAQRIASSRLVRESVFWLWGFDYFSPLQTRATSALSAAAAEVHVMLTAEPGNPFFSLTNSMADRLAEAAREAGAEALVQGVPSECAYEGADVKPAEIRKIERALFSGGRGRGSRVEPGMTVGEPGMTVGEPGMTIGEPGMTDGAVASAPALRFVMAADAYAEAEEAAGEILHLVREEGLRYRDILVLCNDTEHRARAIARVFDAHGIPVFLDSRREVDHNPVLEFILALPEILARGRQADDVFRWIATGLTDLSDADAEELENYAERHRLRGAAWGKPLRHGTGDPSEEIFERVEAAARYVAGTIDAFAAAFGKNRTARERTEGLTSFLTETCRLPERIDALADSLETDGMAVQAQEMRGIWEVAAGIFEQISAVLGGTRLSMDAYATILKAGFASVRIGVLPASSDSVTIGTMQRTRTGRVKAMFVLGANEGELPLFAQDSGLIADEEKETLEEIGIAGFRPDDTLRAEEQLAIYKNLSKPTRLLYMSHDAKPSLIFERLRRLFPDVPVEKASETRQGYATRQRDRRSALRPGQQDGAPVPLSGALGDIGAERMKALLAGEDAAITVSPSALERYSRCPFAFAMDRAINLKELRRREIDSRGIGDVYHEALMRFGRRMSEAGTPSKEGSVWLTAERSDTDRIADEIFAEIGADVGAVQGAAQGAGQGESEAKSAHPQSYAALFDEGDATAAYRRARIRDIVKDVCWALTLRARDGGAEAMMFETSFREGKSLPPIEIEVPASEEPVRVAGRIDRLDILPGDRASVIDYKSGSDRFDKRDVYGGWQLQLMIYLRAAAARYEPQSASYFRIFEPHIDISEGGAAYTDEAIQEAVQGEYRADGITSALPDSEFDALRTAADEALEEAAKGIVSGDATAHPKTKAGGQETACTYCSYLGICNNITE